MEALRALADAAEVAGEHGKDRAMNKIDEMVEAYINETGCPNYHSHRAGMIAALKVLREPTIPMIQAHNAQVIGDFCATKSWQAMIDSILAEGK